MRRYRVVEERGSWYMVSDNYEPARKGNLGCGSFYAYAFDTREQAQRYTDTVNRSNELQDAREILRG